MLGRPSLGAMANSPGPGSPTALLEPGSPKSTFDMGDVRSKAKIKVLWSGAQERALPRMRSTPVTAYPPACAPWPSADARHYRRRS